MDIKKILSTRTFRQATVTLFSTGANGVLAVIFYLTLANVLGSTGYGIFTLSATTITLLVTIFEFGGDRGLVKFISKYRDNLTSKLQVSKLIFITKMIAGLIVSVMSLVFAVPLADLLFHSRDLAYLIPVIGFGVWSQMLFFYDFYYVQAYEKFVWWGSLIVGTNFFRLLLVFTLLLAGKLNPTAAVTLYAFVPLAGFLVGLCAVDKRVFSVKNPLSKLGEVFTFNKWVTAFTITAAVSSRVDTYVTARMINLSDVGVYGLGTQAVAFLPQVITALGAVTAPKFASFRNAGDNRIYVTKSTLFSLGVATLAALIMIPGGLMLFLLSGSQYLSGLVPFMVLLLSMLIFMVTSPIRDSILYFYNRPQFFFWTSIAHGLIAVLSGVMLIPSYGILGSALSNLAGQLFLTICVVVMYSRLSAGQTAVAGRES